MLALVTVLSWIEHSFPHIPGLPPNIKLGLSNIASMYVLFFIGRGEAFILAFLKSCFVMLVRGASAGFISLLGGITAIAVTALVFGFMKENPQYTLLSITGAVMHNLGQIAAASVIFNTFLWYYIPVIIIAGIIMGYITGCLLKAVMPLLLKIFPGS